MDLNLSTFELETIFFCLTFLAIHQLTKGSLFQIYFHQALNQPIAFVYYDKYIQHSLSWQMLANPTILSCRKSLLIGEEKSIAKLLFYHIIRSFQWRQKTKKLVYRANSNPEIVCLLLGYRHLRFNYRSIIDFLVSPSVCLRFLFFLPFDETFIFLLFFFLGLKGNKTSLSFFELRYGMTIFWHSLDKLSRLQYSMSKTHLDFVCHSRMRRYWR